MGRIRDAIARWAGPPRQVEVVKTATDWSIMQRVFDQQAMGDALSDYSSVGNPYETNAVVYAAIRKKAICISGVEWQLLNQQEEPITDGPFFRLFEHPYPGISWSETLEALLSNMDLWGRAFIVFGEYNKGIPITMWVPNTEHMKEIRDKDRKLVGYKYGKGAETKDIPVQDTMEFAYWRKLSPLTAGRLDILQQFHANTYNANFFKQGALLKGFFRNTAPRALTPEQERELERAIQQRGGGGNATAHKIPVFSGVEYVPVGVNQKDMEFLGLQAHSLDYILMCLGVPKAVLGFTDGFNYANMNAIMRDFWTKSLIPIMHLVEWVFFAQFFERFGLPVYGQFNLDGIKELQEDLNQQAQTAKTFYDMGVSFQALNERLELGFPEDLELEDRTPPQLQLPGPEDEEEDEEDEETKRLDEKVLPQSHRKQLAEEKRLRVNRERLILVDMDLRRHEWAATAKRMQKREDAIEPKVRGFFAKCKVQVLDYLKETPEKAVTKEVTGDWLRRFREFLVGLEWGKGLFKAVEEEETATFLAGAKRSYWGLGMRFNLPPEHALLFVKARGLKLQDATDDVVETILKGMEAGMPSDDVAAQVGKVFKHCSEVRAKTIARTETTVAYNGGRVDGMKELGIKRKQWINSNDDNVRDSHRIFNEEAVVEIDSPFTLANGVKVMYPGDGPAAEACNCRCTVASVIE